VATSASLELRRNGAATVFGYHLGAMKLTARALLFTATLSSSLSGCNLQRIAADQTAEIADKGALGFNGFWDYDIFGKAVPGAILQTEALIRVSPENEKLLIGLARTYVVYAYGWMSAEWEALDERGDFERADEQELRLMHVYKRSMEVAMRVVRMHDKRHGELDQKLKSGKAELVLAYLREQYTDKDDVPGLYWAGASWGAMMANSGGDLNALADAPIARALMERAVELDPAYADAGGLGVLGTVEASFPELFGGNLDKARAYYERALDVCKRRNHLILLSYAKTYAVAKQDRELFTKLLREIIDAPDQGDDIRMNNKVARYRAKRYLRRVDEWFPPKLSDEPSASAATP
jgi:tetratricopeptide (TPR) repeat protein